MLFADSLRACSEPSQDAHQVGREGEECDVAEMRHGREDVADLIEEKLYDFALRSDRLSAEILRGSSRQPPSRIARERSRRSP